jgi:hypothetical protein
MAKATQADWEKAKALFEAGKSLSAINSETGIDRATVSKRAKKDGWEKGIYQQLIVDSARVKAEISTLDSTVLSVVEKEIEERTKHMQFFTHATLKNMSSMMKKIGDDTAIIEHKIAQAALKDAKETVLGKTPDTAIQINNGPPVISGFRVVAE